MGVKVRDRARVMGDAKQFPAGDDRLQQKKKQQGIWIAEAMRSSSPFGVIGLLVVLILGVSFRWANLEAKVYWVDEVATSIRIAGTTKALLTQQLATGQLLTVQHLLDVQQLHPALPWSATLAALYHSPEHAPLYFLLARFWLQLTGNGIAQIRSLSVLFSLLSLPALFWLCEELFHSRRTSWIGVMLLSVSPFFVAYAQEARPYSLWSLTLLLMGATLLRAVRTQQRQDWLLYAVAAAIGLYTSLLSLLVLGGQGIYVALRRQQDSGILQQWIRAAGVAVLLFSPWIIVILQQWTMLQDNTTWARIPLSPIAMLAIWLYSVVVLFFDLPVSVSLSVETIAKAFTALFILALIGIALNSLRRSSKSTRLFLLTFALPIPIVLLFIDLISQGQASATPRYLLPLQLVVLFVMSHWLNGSFQGWKKNHAGIVVNRSRRSLKPFIFILLIGFCLMSCISNLNRIPDYQKAHNRFNLPISAIINQANRPFILSEAANTMNLLSLSHSLRPATLQIFPSIDSDISLNFCNTNFLFNPTPGLVDRLSNNTPFTLKEIYQPELLTPEDIHLSLWQLQNKQVQNKQVQNGQTQQNGSGCEQGTAQ
ncbi:glycosyltransferase family 39 protein [Leptolyngbya sp. GB1-A1]|uniref:glycosyltransferase family 39 protein n=1 Tax=Leptolyngbya sp. GB1-A1 TaxID=2933908 RepID=UPI003296CDAA